MDPWRQRLYSHPSKVNFSSSFDEFTALSVLPLAQHLPCREGRQPCTFLRFNCSKFGFCFGNFCSMSFHLFLGRTWPSGCLAQNTPVMNFIFPNIVYFYQFVNLGDLVNSKCIMIGLVSWYNGSVGGERIVDSWVGHLNMFVALRSWVNKI